MAKKAAKGSGSIRKKAVISGGRTYHYWEARLTTGHDPATGRQVQRSCSGKTQREVREKMQAAAAQAQGGHTSALSRRTLASWLDEWLDGFLCGAKPATRSIYENNVKNHIKPALGALRLEELRPEAVQSFIGGMEGLAPASVRLAYKVLRKTGCLLRATKTWRYFYYGYGRKDKHDGVERLSSAWYEQQRGSKEPGKTVFRLSH